MTPAFIKPDWPVPSHIKAYTTLRKGCGISLASYREFNLAEHVGDDNDHVKTNREQLKTLLALPNEPIWLEQTHSQIALPALPENRGKEADAAFTDQINQVCVVLTADCLPVFLCDQQGKHVAAIHAGWKGLAQGIIEETVKKMALPPTEIVAWLGPAISAAVYEVGSEVRDKFLNIDPEAETAFLPAPKGKWLGNLHALAHLRLQKQNIQQIYGDEYCTYRNPELFFSARRDGFKTGRMASLIWITPAS